MKLIFKFGVFYLLGFLICCSISAQDLIFKSLGKPLASNIYFIATTEDSIWVSTDSAFYKSVDGENWNPTNKTFPKGYSSLKVFSNGYYYTTAKESVLRSRDKGVTWDILDANINNIGDLSITELVETPNHKLILTGIEVNTLLTKVYSSADWGDTWIEIGLINLDVLHIAFNSAGKYVVAGQSGISICDDLTNIVANPFAKPVGSLQKTTTTTGQEMFLLAAYDQGIMYSLDGGNTWAKYLNGGPTPEVIHVRKGKNKIWAVSDQNKIYYSKDTGQTWVYTPFLEINETEGVVEISENDVYFFFQDKYKLNVTTNQWEIKELPFDELLMFDLRFFENRNIFLNAFRRVYYQTKENKKWTPYTRDILIWGQLNEIALGLSSDSVFKSADGLNWVYVCQYQDYANTIFAGEKLIKYPSVFAPINPFPHKDTLYFSDDFGISLKIFAILDLPANCKPAQVVFDGESKLFCRTRISYPAVADSIFVLDLNGKVLKSFSSELINSTIFSTNRILWLRSGGSIKYFDEGTNSWRTSGIPGYVEHLVYNPVNHKYYASKSSGIYMLDDLNDSGILVSTVVGHWMEIFRNDLFVLTQNDVLKTINFFDAGEKEKETLLLYPVPAASDLQIKVASTAKGALFIYDELGNLALKLDGTFDENTFDISSLRNGLYFVKLVLPDRTLYSRFVKIYK